eukprot:265643-Karenia_brevis.AAC.1
MGADKASSMRTMGFRANAIIFNMKNVTSSVDLKAIVTNLNSITNKDAQTKMHTLIIGTIPISFNASMGADKPSSKRT